MLEDQSLILSLITFEPVSPSIGNWYESQIHHKGGNQRALQVFGLGAQPGEREGLLYLAMQFLSLPQRDERTSFPSPALCLAPVNSDCTFRELTWFSWGHPCTQKVRRGDATVFSASLNLHAARPFGHWPRSDSSSFFSLTNSISSSDILLCHIRTMLPDARHVRWSYIFHLLRYDIFRQMYTCT